MIAKDSLLLNASIKNDEERFAKLIEYDFEQGGVMLYRYRHLSEGTKYEIEALEKCKIWATNPQNFDDQNEFIPTAISSKDYECVRFFLEYGLRNVSSKERKKQMAEIDKLYYREGRALLKYFIDVLKRARREYAVSCFTENSPYDNDHNMWHQYAKDRGMCLGYSLSTLVKSGIIIDPVYYVDSKEKTLGNMFELFGKDIRMALCCCIKEKYGVDQFDDKSDLICWSDQNEWRYIINNNIDKLTNDYSNGCYLNKLIVPDIVYTKNLSFKQYCMVMMAAHKNRVPVKRIV